MTREEWILEAIEILRGDLQHIAPVPAKIVLLDYWPHARKTKRHLLGGCCNHYGYPRIFIPLWISDPLVVLETLVHELIHASVGCKHQHGIPFQIPAADIGLEGKMHSTIAGKKLRARLKVIADTLGIYFGATT